MPTREHTVIDIKQRVARAVVRWLPAVFGGVGAAYSWISQYFAVSALSDLSYWRVLTAGLMGMGFGVIGWIRPDNRVFCALGASILLFIAMTIIAVTGTHGSFGTFVVGLMLSILLFWLLIKSD